MVLNSSKPETDHNCYLAGFNLVHLAMFAKYWESGKVKTRLARVIGNDAARDVYQLFVQHLVRRFEGVGDRRTLVFSPSDTEMEFREAIPLSWGLQPQSEGDLGERMMAFFQDNGSTRERKNILIGSDAPELTVSIILQAAELLGETPVVLGPSPDGGYYLIGMKGTSADLFDDVPWSTDQVLKRTIEKLEQQQVEYSLLPELHDIDEFDGLQHLVARLKRDVRDVLDKELLEKLSKMGLADA